MSLPTFRIYIAAPLTHRQAALDLASMARMAGHEVVSTWHGLASATVDDEARLEPAEHQAIAAKCLAEVASADRLWMILPPSNGRVGSYVEAGFAMGRGIPVILVLADGRTDVPLMLSSCPVSPL